MTRWRPVFNPAHLYFVTTTAVGRQSLFKRPVIKRLIVDTIDCMRLRGRFRMYAFVVMPNHIHLIIHCQEEDPLADCIPDLKKQIADRVVRQYRAEGAKGVLHALETADTRRSKHGHKVWEDGYDARDVFSPEFMEQKMTYLHHNPCQPHWDLAERPEDYVWSSARFYLLGEPAIIPVDNIAEYVV